MVAVLNPERRGDAFLQLHPDYRSPEMIEDMFAVAEENLSVPGKEKKRMLYVWTNRSDGLQQEILKRRGYTLLDETESKEYLRRRSLDIPIPDLKNEAGYTIRAIGDVDEILARSWASEFRN